MSLQLLYPLSFLSLLLFLFVVLVKIQSSLSNPGMYGDCLRPFRCGNIVAGYPFWGRGYENRPGFCGHPKLHLECDGDTTTMTIDDVKFTVLHINEETQLLKIRRWEFSHGICPPNLTGLPDTTIDSELFEYSYWCKNLTLHYAIPLPEHTCWWEDINYTNGIVRPAKSPPPKNFTFNITTLVLETLYPAAKDSLRGLEEALEEGFKVELKVDGTCKKCIESKGSCGYNDTSNGFTCYCPNHPFLPLEVCPTPSGSFFDKHKMSVVIGTTATAVGLVIILCVLVIAGQGREFMLDKVPFFSRKKKENHQHIEAFVRNNGSLAPKRYKYSDVKKMTKSFSNKLGQGGYGNVYKGRLPDGRLVAVKVLKESTGNGEEFINEVASISRTSHVNIVTLLGFCYERKKRALIYEFMPNGSLDKFIYHHEPSSINRKLEWRTMYQIAVGIARGLEYLHRGCNVRIVHFDIKPQNILLDEDFCPKISDFGLAKQSKKKESIMSMLDRRGTVGYIAPEVFCRNFGGVSPKSDVYSYGMMTLEMVQGGKNIDVRVSHTSEVYFPDSIYMHLESGNDFKLDGVVTEEEKDIAKKMIVISLWCIQTLPSDRPSMSKVVEMLEGSLENLQIPPKPTLSSPARAHKHSPRASSATQLASEEESYRYEILNSYQSVPTSKSSTS